MLQVLVSTWVDFRRICEQIWAQESILSGQMLLSALNRRNAIKGHASLMNSQLVAVALNPIAPQTKVGRAYGNSLKKWISPNTRGYCPAGSANAPPENNQI